MKTWKFIVAILAIFGIAFAFVACDDGNGKTNEPPDPRAAFLGIWIHENGPIGSITMTIDADLHVWDQSHGFWKINNPVWTEIDNNNDETKGEYPSGYKLSGTFADDSTSMVGGEYSYLLFINAMKNKLCVEGEGENFPFVFIKQGN